MFGLTFEKLFLVAIIAAVVIGPQRLPAYAARLGELIRALRQAIDASRHTLAADVGVTAADLAALDPRRYDPRRIVREALADRPPTTAEAASPDPEVLAQAARIRPGQRYLVTGSAAHPRRILLSSLPEDDPRRLAAEAVPLDAPVQDVPPTGPADDQARISSTQAGTISEAGPSRDSVKSSEVPVGSRLSSSVSAPAPPAKWTNAAAG